MRPAGFLHQPRETGLRDVPEVAEYVPTLAYMLKPQRSDDFERAYSQRERDRSGQSVQR